MALAAPEVRVGISGELFSAPLGTTLPTDATTALSSDYVGHGYSSDDGVTENWDDSVDNIVAWQNATVVRSARTESIATFATTLLQTRGSNLELFYPGSLVQPNNSEWMIEVVPAVADPRVFVIQVVDGANIIRVVIGNGEVTERGEVPVQNGEAVMYPVTMTCYPDDNGILFTKFSNDDAFGTDISGS